jgi:hypothetical protein
LFIRHPLIGAGRLPGTDILLSTGGAGDCG